MFTDPPDAPVNLAQWGLLFDNEHLGRGRLHRIVWATRLTGHLDPAALRAALNRVVRRHEALRTALLTVDGEWRQRLTGAVTFPVEQRPLDDGTAVPDALAEFFDRPFDLTRPPLARGLLLRIGDAEHILAFGLHHAICDRWSLRIILSDLAYAYPGRALPPPPPSFLAMCVRRATPTAAAELDAFHRHWVRLLESRAARPDVAIGQPDAARDFEAAQVLRHLAPDRMTTLTALARRHEASPHAVVLAAYAVLLHRLGAASPVVIGVPLAGRAAPGAEDVVGMLVHTVPLPLDVAGGTPLSSLIRLARDAVTAAADRSELSPARLAAALAPTRAARGHPLFRYLLDWSEADPHLMLQGCASEALRVPAQPSPFDLALLVTAADQGLELVFEYATAVFGRHHATTIADGFHRVLEAMLTDPAQSVDAVTLAPGVAAGGGPAPGGDAVTLAPGTAARVSPALGGEVWAVIRERMRTAPHRVAVREHGRSITYSQLQRHSTELATRLRRAGVTDGQIVAIWLERGTDAIVAMLATMSLGCAFAPVDGRDPPARVAELLRRIRPAAVVSGGARPPECAGVAPVWIGPEVTHDAGAPGPRAAAAAAYIATTSGSSGRAGLVVVGHRAFGNHVATTRASFALEPVDRVLHFAPIAFDAAIEEIFPALTAGACVVVRPAAASWSVDALSQVCTAEQVTVLDLPTGFWGQYAEALDARGAALPRRVRLVVIGGEAPRTAWLQTWRRIAARHERPPRLVNTYGPTEATVVATTRDLDGAPGDVMGGLVCIGSPVAGATAHVLDARLRPVPRGVTGELYLGGVPVALGYLDEPARTAAAFLPDPFAAGGGARLYRTADLVRQGHDGELFFAGRADDQIKARGHRVEPAEVEAALLRHRAVSDAAVLTAAAGSRLVAVVVADPAVPDGELLAHASRLLPAHMCPSTLVRSPEVPRTPRGKRDRAALAQLVAARGAAEQDGPVGERERAMHAAWREAFGDVPIGVTDDFLRLGGHSLLAVRLAELLRRRGLRLGVDDLLAYRTIRALAPRVRPIEAAATGSRRPAGAGHAPDHAPLTAVQQGIWVEDQWGGPASPYWTVTALRVHGPLDAGRLERAIRSVLTATPVLRAGVTFSDGELVQHADAVRPPILLHRGTPTRPLVAGAGPALTPGAPVARFELWTETATCQVLAVHLHHLVADGDTARMIMADVAAAYRGDEPAPRPSFFELARASVPGGDVDGWLRRLDGATFDIALPTDRPADRAREPRAHTVRTRLGPADAARMDDLGRAAGVTGFVVALAVTACWLHRVCGQDDLVIGVAVSRRGDPARAGTIGPLIDLAPIPARLRPRQCLRDTLSGIADAVGAALATPQIPLAAIVRRLGLTAFAAAHGSLFRVLFDVADESGSAPPALGDCVVQEIEVPIATCRADLELSVRRGAGLDLQLRARADVFDRGTAQSLAASFAHFVSQALADPDRRLRWVPLTDQSSPVPAGAAVPADAILARFGRLSSAHPGRTAIRSTGRTLSYTDVAVQVHRFASVLPPRVCGRPPRVALLLHRGADVPVAMLGTWRCGGTPILLDPGQPAGRLRSMLAAAQPDAVLVEPATADLARRAGATRLMLVTDLPDVVGDAGVPPIPPDPAVAYVTFTSGSTGEPKAVATPSAGLANLLAWSRQAIPLTADDVFLHVAAPGFDIAVWEMLHPLLSPAQLAVLDPARHGDPRAIIEAVDRWGVTAVHLVPGMLSAVLDEVRTGEAGTLRTVICGGDLVTPSLRARLLERLDVDLHHTYGPTEASIFVARWLGRQDPPTPLRLPLGTPIAGVALQVLDEAGALLPQGVAGELAIGGTAVGRGYPGQPAATAARFTPDPHGGAGARRYRTGDRARRRADGTIEFLGRLDRQVKVAGVRIEPGEIEAQLARHPGVAECVVTSSGAGERAELIAYLTAVTGDPGPQLGAQLRAFLRERLPAAFVPARFEVLARLPRLCNGKVDVSALPAPRDPPPTGDAPATGAQAAPGSPVERQLLDVWAGVLGDASLGVDDNFFDRGGDSIAALRIVSRARAAGLVVRVGDVLRAQTIARLAELVRTGVASPPAAGGEADPDAPLPLSPQQAEFAARHPRLPSHHTQTVVVEMPATVGTVTVGAAALGQALGAVVAHHDGLRQRWRPAGPGPPSTFIAAPGAGPFPVTAIQVPAADRVPAAVTAAGDALRRTLDVRHGPLLAAAILHGTAPTLVVLCAHHLAVDRVSWDILLDDLRQALDAVTHDRTPQLPAVACPLPRWLRTVDADVAARVTADRDRWQEIVGAPCAPLPRDGAGLGTDGVGLGREGAGLGTDGAGLGREASRTALRRTWPAAGSQALWQAASRWGLRRHEVVLAALAGAIGDWSRAGDLLIELEDNGRSALGGHPDLSRTVGWLASSFPVRLCLPEQPTAEQLLHAVRRAVRDLPQPRVGYALLRNRGLVTPVSEPEVGFNYLGELGAPATGAGLRQRTDLDPGPERDPTLPRPLLIETEAWTDNGRLVVEVVGSSDLHERATPQRILDGLAHRLREVVALDDGNAVEAEESLPEVVALDDGNAVEAEESLTPLQAGMLAETLRAEGAALYHTQVVYALDGPVDTDVLRRAWQRMVTRADAFRTGFAWRDGDEPRQRVFRRVGVDWRVHRWPEHDPAELESRLAELLAADRREPFDLERPGLSRVHLVLAPGSRRLVWAHHHALFDGWSLPLVSRILAEEYAAAGASADPLPALPSHLEFARWWRGVDRAADSAYWRGVLAGLEPHPAAPGAAAGVPGGRTVLSRVDRRRSAVLRRLARDRRVTLNALVVAAWAAVVQRRVRRSDVVVGAVVAVRPPQIPDVESIVGLGMNTIPLRLRFAAATSFGALIRQVQDRIVDAYPHAAAPLTEALRHVGAVGPARSLFDTVVVYENYPGDRRGAPLGGGRLRVIGSHEDHGHPLVLVALPDDELTFELMHAPPFDAGDAAAILADLVSVLTTAADGGAS